MMLRTPETGDGMQANSFSRIESQLQETVKRYVREYSRSVSPIPRTCRLIDPNPKEEVNPVPSPKRDLVAMRVRSMPLPVI